MIFREIFNKHRILIGLSLNRSQKSRNVHSQYRVLFFGSDNFSLPSLKLISKENSSNGLISDLGVVTSFKSRNNPVKQYASENNIVIHNWEDVKNDHQICSKYHFGIVVSFGHLIPEDIINSFKKDMLNVHASLLPKYRGSSPIIYAIKNHEKITGVSIMKIEPKKFDVGDILAQKELTIHDDILMPQLHDQLANIGAESLVECLRDYDNIIPIAQNSQHATYAPKIDNEFCKVRWSEMSSTQVYDLYRAVYSFKHILTSFRNEPVKLLEMAKSSNVDNKQDDRKVGHVRFCWKGRRLLVCCADKRDVEVIRLSIGKKVMSASDFNNGFLRKRGEVEYFE